MEKVDNGVFARGYALYSRLETKDTYFELWGASTKHPDCAFCFEYFTPSIFMSYEENIIAWMAWIASQMQYRWDVLKMLDLINDFRSNVCD